MNKTKMKQVILDKINNDPFLIRNCRLSLYRNKVYVVFHSVRENIATYCKTKRGAESYINKNKSLSFYDESFMEMCSPNADLDYIEVLDCELKSINDIKMWYFYLKDNVNKVYLPSLLNLAKEYCTDTSIPSYIEEVIKDFELHDSFKIIDEYEECNLNKTIITKESIEERTKEVIEEPIEEVVSNIVVTINKEKDGVEIHFDSKPNKIIRDSLKLNGFRYSKRNNLWYSKFSDETLEFANTIANSSEKDLINIQEETNNKIVNDCEEIDIDDIISFTVGEDLAKRVISSSLFCRGDRDFSKEIQTELQRANDKVIDLIDKGCSKEVEFRAKKYLQSFKHRYYSLYIKKLQHTADNPSWMVTGRGGLNASRYNKKVEQFNRIIKDMINLSDSFDSQIDKLFNVIFMEKRKANTELKEKLKSNIIDLPVFEKVKINIQAAATRNIYTNTDRIINGYRIKGNKDYTIINNWGAWRIYNKEGNDIDKEKTLGEAKKLLVAILNKKQEKAII